MWLSDTANVAVPVRFVTWEAGVMLEDPPEAVRVTVRPTTGLPDPSYKYTVTLAALTPSAGTEDALVTMAQSAATGRIGGGVPNVTVTVWEMARSRSEVSTA